MTKRLLSVLVAVLMVMALIPMSALAAEASSRSGESVKAPETVVSPKEAVIAFDFETEPSDWQFIDDDGDGFNWDWQGDYSQTPHMTAYEGEGLIFSASYDNDSGVALTPDNWAITPAIDVPDDATTLTFWVAGQDASYAAEHYAVYAGTSDDIDDMFVIMPEAVATGTYTQKTIDITDFAGETVYFAIRHFNITDMFFLNIDLVEINNDAIPEPTEEPEPVEPGDGESIIWDFETEESIDGWTLYDADGDGYCWDWMNSEDYADYTHNGIGMIASASYDNNYGVLYPDNWVFTPGVAVEDLSAVTFSFWYAAQDSSWAAEHFAVYAGNSADPDDMVEVLSETIVQAKAVGTYREIVIDNLDEFDLEAGTIYFAIRHYNCSDMFRLNVDDAMLVIGNGGGEPGGDEPIPDNPDDSEYITWIRVYGFEAPVQYDLAEDHLNLTVPETAHYYIAESYWWDDTAWHRLVEGDTFEPGHVYSVMVKVEAEEGYTIEQKVKFLADDSTETIDWDYTGRESETVAWLAVLPVETVMSDLDRALNVEGGTLHFVTGGNYPWVTATAGDRFYAKSGNAGVASSSSTVSTTIEAAEGDVLTFDFKAWGEGSSWDVCTFAVDGSLVFSYGAYDNDWELFKYELTPGTHTLTWTYSKDSSVNPTGDYFAVDEVYVGEPVPVEEIILDAESILVPVNRTEKITYTVIPANAFNQDVTFVCDDESIATVTDKGVVFGVAEGETFVTVTSVSNPEVYAVCEVEVVDNGDFLSNIYGIAAYDPTYETGDMWINFLNALPSEVTTVGEAPEGAYAAAYAHGMIYGIDSYGDFFTCEFTPEAIGAPTYIEGVVSGMTVVSMTYDYYHGALFAVGIDDNDVSHLLGVDKDTGMVFDLAELDFIAINIAADENGYAYMIDFDTGDLVRIDLESYDYEVVGNTGMPVSYVQDMCYDFDHYVLYWAQYYDEGTLLCIDPDTGDVLENFGLIGAEGTETCGMFVLPEADEPEDGGPFEVESIEIIPEEVEIYVGQTYQFEVVVSPFYADAASVEWTVDDEGIISVDMDGVVEGLALGTAYVTASCGDLEASALVTVVAPPVAGWYFETDPEEEGWEFVDADGDWYTWEWDYGNASGGIKVYEGEGIIVSESYINYYGALTPDNWAISPAVEIPMMNGKVTLWAVGQDSNGYWNENFAIYAGLTPEIEDMVQVSDEYVTTADYQRFEADLSEFAGETVYIAIRHFNVTDEFRLNVDQVEIWGKNMMWGDANGDGVVDTVDALLLMRWVMGIEELDEENLYPWCDVNGDGVIDFTDALLIARKVMGIIDYFPVEEVPEG